MTESPVTRTVTCVAAPHRADTASTCPSRHRITRRTLVGIPGAASGSVALMSRPKPATVKTERLLNLVIALLYTRQPMSKSRIRRAVPQYQDASDEAFDRMFERDKVELRKLGIPLRTEIIDPLFDD